MFGSNRARSDEVDARPRGKEDRSLSPPLERGEGGGEGRTASILEFAPHPTPLPVKNGEREQTELAAGSNRN